jgi:hypothetical protein
LVLVGPRPAPVFPPSLLEENPLSPADCAHPGRKPESVKVKPPAEPLPELTVGFLRDLFHAADGVWLLYRRPNGTVGVQAPTKRGYRNYDAAIARGCQKIGTATGVSRAEAVRAAKKKSSARQ